MLSYTNKKKTTLLLLVSAILSLLVFFSSCAKNEEIEVVEEPVKEEFIEEVEEKEEIFSESEKQLLETWKKHKEINDDFVGDLIFDSKLIELPVVCGEYNSTYERTNWETLEHDEEGSIFMDSFCTKDSSNITIYGHYVYPALDPEQTHKFSPLTKLLKKENYEENKNLIFVLDNEIRFYEVAYVYYLPLNYSSSLGYFVDQDKLYYISEFTPEYFEKYKQFVKENVLYDTGVDVDFLDKTITLQTCVENRNDLREIIICKEIARKIGV